MIHLGELLKEGLSATVYFIGIGGIGMSALARYFLAHGLKVMGYDRAETKLTQELVKEGAVIHYTEDLNQIPRDARLVVYTPAVPAEHTELQYYRQHNFNVVKRSDVLQAISAGSYNICIAGTHGKTTITTMVGHVLMHSGYGGSAFLGGISVNYQTNFWSAVPSTEIETSLKNVTVIEADEYDRSFLKLSPEIAVITSMDADHLDIYGDEKNMQDAFIAFANSTAEDGTVFIKHGLKRSSEITVKDLRSYSLQNDAADIFGKNIRIDEGGYVFDVQVGEDEITGITLRIGGMHNVENAVVTTAIAQRLKIDDVKIRAALADFKGVRRRFEYVIAPRPQQPGGYVLPVLIDDYAHHPEELKALLGSVRSLFPQRVVTVIFQPHLFSRTRDLAEGFAQSLSLADRVILLPIYPARELPIEGVSSQLILDKITVTDKRIVPMQELPDWMQQHAKIINKELGEVIVMAGAGDIDTLVQPVKQILERI